MKPRVWHSSVLASICWIALAAFGYYLWRHVGCP